MPVNFNCILNLVCDSTLVTSKHCTGYTSIMGESHLECINISGSKGWSIFTTKIHGKEIQVTLCKACTKEFEAKKIKDKEESK